MNIKKTLLIGLPIAALVMVAAIAGFVLLIFSLTRGATDAADRFLALSAEGKHHEAYLSTASAFRAQQDEASFITMMGQLGLDGYASASWPSRSIVNNEATLEGSVTTRAGAVIPVTMNLIKEKGEWRVLGLTVARGGIQPDVAGKQLPPDDELSRLVTRTLLDFNGALQARDFIAFHAKVSEFWQRQIAPEQLETAFQPLIDREVDLAAIEHVAPIFREPPALDENGMLVLEGYYPTRQARVIFELTYTYEHPQWKLFGINVGLQAQESQD